MANTATRLSANGSLTISGSFDEVTYNPTSNVVVNLLDYTQDYTNAYWTKRLTISSTSELAPDNSYTATLLTFNLQFANVTASTSKFQNTFGKTYTFSVYAKTTAIRIGLVTNSSYHNFNLDTGTLEGGFGGTQQISKEANGFYRCSVTFTSTSQTEAFAVWLGGYNGLSFVGKTMTLWGEQIELGSTLSPYQPRDATNIFPSNTASKLINFSSNNSTLYIKGEYDEVSYNPSSNVIKNLAVNSNNFSFGGYNRIATPNALAPDNSRTAYLIQETSDAGITPHGAGLQINNTKANVTYTVSLFAKSYSGDRIFMFGFGAQYLGYNSSGNPNYNYGIFNILNGTAVVASFATFNNPTVAITNVGDGWYRCSLTFTPLFPVTFGGIDLQMLNYPGQTSNFIGNGNSGFYLWGCQCEEGNTATTYVATGANSIPAPTFVQRTTNTGNTYVKTLYDEVYTGSLNMVTNGLTLYMDAAKLDSYSETGTLWRDIGAGSNFAATFTSTPIHVNKDYIAFNGTYNADIGKTPAQLGMYNQPFTVMALFRVPDVTPYAQAFGLNDHMILGTSTTITQQGLHLGTRNNTFFMGFYSADASGGTVVPNTWYFVTWVWNNSSPYYSIYVNGSSVPVGGGNTPFLGTTNVLIASSFLGQHKSDVNMIGIYNRALTASEVLQNYNAFRGPFGI